MNRSIGDKTFPSPLLTFEKGGGGGVTTQIRPLELCKLKGEVVGRNLWLSGNSSTPSNKSITGLFSKTFLIILSVSHPQTKLRKFSIPSISRTSKVILFIY